MLDTVENQRREGLLVDLDACLIQMEASQLWFAKRVLPLSLDQLRWRPNPRRWSIAECLDHLDKVLAHYLPKIDEAIAQARPQNGAAAFSSPLDWTEREALLRVEPPAVIRIPRRPTITPPVDLDSLIEQFPRIRDRYSQSVRRAGGLDLARILLREPIHPVIHSLGGVILLMAAHDRRHIWQAEQVRHSSGFPRSILERIPSL